jgi:hypothetical protein
MKGTMFSLCWEMADEYYGGYPGALIDDMAGFGFGRLTNDVGVSRVLAPTGTVDSGAVITPQAKVENYGEATETFPVIFRMGTGYLDTETVSNLKPGDSAIVSFRPWTALDSGKYATRCSTALLNDSLPVNDAVSDSVIVRTRNHDAGVLAILAPQGVIAPGDTVVPRAVVRNYGTFAEVFPVKFVIGESWRDSIIDTLQPGTNDTVRFRTWVADPEGHYFEQCSTALAGDMNPADDFARDSFWVIATGNAEAARPLKVPRTLVLGGGAPNPFADRTLISFGLPKGQQYRLAVYNSAGVLVQVLASGYAEPGYYIAGWRGADEQGNRVSEGIYFVRLETAAAAMTRKLVKMR